MSEYRAMVLERPGSGLLRLATRLGPEPKPGEVLVEASACGVCCTDLHAVDGDLKDPKQPIVPGHEIVGRVAATGEGVEQFQAGDRVGVPWLVYTCGVCDFCRDGRENLCPSAQFVHWIPNRWRLCGILLGRSAILFSYRGGL